VDPLDPTAVGAALIALVHTLAGPDHYVPFIALARSQGWSLPRLLAVTALCGLAHVLSSVLLGLVAALAGAAVANVDAVREAAGLATGYGLVVLGALYALYGLWRGAGGSGHTHAHVHADGTLHWHAHGHPSAPSPGGHHGTHVKAGRSRPGVVPAGASAWVLFLIFAFGPCEPLIAFSFPVGLSRDWTQLIRVSGVFTVATLVTMLVVVTAATTGLSRLRLPRLSRWGHFLAGLAIFGSGGGMVWFGL